MFRNTLAPNDKYLVRDSVNFSSLIEKQLSLNQPAFSDSFVPFVDYTSDFKHFEKKDDRHSYFISEITDCEGVG